MTKWYQFWKAIDHARLVPRLCLFGYAYQMYSIQQWFQGLKDPTGAQGTFVAVVYGVAPLVLNFYMQNGTDWAKLKEAAVPKE